MGPLRGWWRSLSERDRRLAAFAGALIVLFLLWMLAVQPALGTLRRAPAEIDTLDAERSLAAAQQALVQVRLAEALNRLALYKALGGAERAG